MLASGSQKAVSLPPLGTQPTLCFPGEIPGFKSPAQGTSDTLSTTKSMIARTAGLLGPWAPLHPVGEQRPCEGCKLELGSVLDACPHPDSKSVLPTSPFVLDLPLHVSPALRLVPWTRARYLGSQLPRWAPQPLCTATRGVF